MQSLSWSNSKVKEVWQIACAQLELELSNGVYNIWILPNPLTKVTISQGKAIAVINSPTGFYSTNVKNKFGAHLQRVLSGVIGKPVEISYQISSPALNKSKQSQTTSDSRGGGNNNSSSPSASLIGSTSLVRSHSPIGSNSAQSPRAEDLFSQASVESVEKNQSAVRAKNIGLRQDYSFETFAVSSSNEMAHAAASAVSKNPGEAYNPLFLYGGVGVGKTHLMQAIGRNILLHQPTAKVIYSTSEEFTNQIVNAIQTKSTIRFKERYRTADVLLLDDVQFIAGKDSVQEEFFHTFNALAKNNKQIVLTSDRPPHEILLLEGRLRSRLEAGLMIDIQQPSFELRTAILLIKSKAAGIPIEIEMAKMIASRVDSARKIGGILNSLKSEIELNGQELTPELIEHILITEVDQKRPQIKAQIQQVIKTVSNHYYLKQQVVKGKSRKKKITLARHIAMYVCKEDLGEPYAEIGRWFSGRDHSTVMHAYHKIQEMTAKDESLAQEISAIRMSLIGMR
ncbi:chromosomal replication initiator protein DnaA [Patescibacteria group bacterium]|nr:chromosomal replication initiator protein DnaA [Patescibacteria group bacterium]MBU1885983.1 chromosomal replication initiator protein DnaA [Patescibacteria group bacterium]